MNSASEVKGTDEGVTSEDIASSFPTLVWKDDDENDSKWFDAIEKDSESSQILKNKENQDIMNMRRIWSYAVLGLIVVIVFFDCYMVSKIGSHEWSFDSPIIVITVISDNFLKIVGLGLLITREIFKKIFK